MGKTSYTKTGFIDQQGEIVIPLKFLSVSSFSEGIAAVKPSLEAGWGLIDTAGNWIVEPCFPLLMPFSEGLACARSERWGYIDFQGQWVIEPRFRGAGSFQHGLAEITGRSRDYHPTGYIDREGYYLWEPTTKV